MNNNTVITYCTTGVLLRRLQSDSPAGITHIIVDEIHERSILSDFLLLLLRRLLPANPGLKVILMSATLDQKLFSDYFGGIPAVSVEGRLFPVEEKYLEDVVFDTRYSPSAFTEQIDFSRRSSDVASLLTSWCERFQDYGLIPHLLRHLFDTHRDWEGVVLVFLSGAAEIKSVGRLIDDAFAGSSYEVEVVACHGALSTQEQKRVFEVVPRRRRVRAAVILDP